MTIIFWTVAAYFIFLGYKNHLRKKKRDLSYVHIDTVEERVLQDDNISSFSCVADFESMTLRTWSMVDTMTWTTVYRLSFIDGRFKQSCWHSEQDDINYKEVKIEKGAINYKAIDRELDLGARMNNCKTVEEWIDFQIKERKSEIEWHIPEPDVESALVEKYKLYQAFCLKHPTI